MLLSPEPAMRLDGGAAAVIRRVSYWLEARFWWAPGAQGRGGGPMKKIRWWVLGAIVAASATAAALGPVLRGQPNLTPAQPKAEAQAPHPSPVTSTPSPYGPLPPAGPSTPIPATPPAATPPAPSLLIEVPEAPKPKAAATTATNKETAR